MNSHEFIKTIVATLTDAYPYETALFANIGSLETLVDVYKSINRRYPPQTLSHCLKIVYDTCETHDPELQNHVRSFLQSAQQVDTLCSLFLPAVSEKEMTNPNEEQGVSLQQLVDEQAVQIKEILARLSAVEKHVRDLQFYCF